MNLNRKELGHLFMQTHTWIEQGPISIPSSFLFEVAHGELVPIGKSSLKAFQGHYSVDAFPGGYELS